MNSRSAPRRSQRWSRPLVAGLPGILLMLIGPWSPLWASPAPMRPNGPPAIPLREQPFYPELLATDLQMRRISNLVMPVCRVPGGLVATVLIYRLLIYRLLIALAAEQIEIPFPTQLQLQRKA